MTKPKKFERGYLSYRKGREIRGIITDIALGLAVFVVGLLLNKMYYRNVFTVVALLFVLPMARHISILSALMPYMPVSDEMAERAGAALGKCGRLLYDPVFTSKERVMHFSLIALVNGRVLCYDLPERKKSGIISFKSKMGNADAAKAYLAEHIKNQARHDKVETFSDFEKFLRAFPKTELPEEALASLDELAESMEYFVI